MPSHSVYLLPCLGCGHLAEHHEVENRGEYRTNDGALIPDIRLGPCLHESCGCEEWDPDMLHHVSALLGLDVRRAIIG